MALNPGPGLADQIIDLPIASGLNDAHDSLTDDTLLLQEASDCIILKDGSITRRVGCNDAAGTTGAYPNSIFERDQRLFSWAESGFYARPDEAGTITKYLNYRAPRPCLVMVDPHIRAPKDVLGPECASGNGYLCTVWQDYLVRPSDQLGSLSSLTGVHARITDEATGAVLKEQTLHTLATNIRVVLVGSKFMAVAVTGDFNKTAWFFDTTTPTGSWTAGLEVGGKECESYDICVAANPGTHSTAYIANYSTSEVVLTSVTSTGTVVHADPAFITDVCAVSLCHNQTNSAVYTAVWRNIGTGGEIEVYETPLASFTTSFTLRGTVSVTDYAFAYSKASNVPFEQAVTIEQNSLVDGHMVLAYSWAYAHGSFGYPVTAGALGVGHCTESYLLSYNGTVDATTHAISPGYALASKAFLDTTESTGGQVVFLLRWSDTPSMTAYAEATSPKSLQSTGLLVTPAWVATDTYAHVPVARVFDSGLAKLAQAATAKYYPRPIPNLIRSSVTADMILIPGAVYTRAPITQTVSPTTIGINVAKVTRRDSCKPIRWINAMGTVHAHGGFHTINDGVRGYENTPHHYIETPWAQLVQGIFGSPDYGWFPTATSHHSVCFYWVYWDESGLEHRSAVSQPCDSGVSFTGPTDRPKFYLSPPPLSANDSLTLRAYCTGDLEDSTVAADAFYLFYEIEASLLTKALESGWVELDGTMPPTTENTELLYTSGGVLEALPPPALLDICAWQDVLVGVNAENRNELWYTKPFEPGIAPEWNPALTIQVPSEGGDIVGISSLDDKLIVLKEHSIYYVVGSLRDRLGQGNDPTVVRVASDIGCASKQTMAVVPDGLLFIANQGRGLAMLDRGASVHRMRAAEDRFTDPSLIHSTIVVTSESNVRWGIRHTLQDGSYAGSAVTLNYDIGAFTTFTEYKGVQHQCLVDGRVWLLDGTFPYRESDATENPAYPAPYWSISTAWVKVGTIQGFERLKRLGLLATPTGYGSNLGVTLKVDGFVNYNQTSTVDYSATWPASAFGSSGHQLGLHVPKQKATSHKFTISEVAVSPVPVEAMLDPITLSGLSLRLGVKKGHQKLAAGSRTPVVT